MSHCKNLNPDQNKIHSAHSAVSCCFHHFWFYTSVSEITHLSSLPVDQPNACSDNAAITAIMLKFCFVSQPQKQLMNHTRTLVSTYHKNAVFGFLPPFSPFPPPPHSPNFNELSYSHSSFYRKYMCQGKELNKIISDCYDM